MVSRLVNTFMVSIIVIKDNVNRHLKYSKWTLRFNGLDLKDVSDRCLFIKSSSLNHPNPSICYLNIFVLFLPFSALFGCSSYFLAVDLVSINAFGDSHTEREIFF